MASVSLFLPNPRLVLAAGFDSRPLAESVSVVGWFVSPRSAWDLPLLFPSHPARAKEPPPAALLLPSPDVRVRALFASILRTHSSYPGHLLTSLSPPLIRTVGRPCLFVKHLESVARGASVKNHAERCKKPLTRFLTRIGVRYTPDQRARSRTP